MPLRLKNFFFPQSRAVAGLRFDRFAPLPTSRGPSFEIAPNATRRAVNGVAPISREKRRRDRAVSEDVSHLLELSGASVVAIALRRPDAFVVFVGNTGENSVAAAFRLAEVPFARERSMRVYDNLRNAWTDAERVPADRLLTGTPLEIERKGFCLIEIRS